MARSFLLVCAVAFLSACHAMPSSGQGGFAPTSQTANLDGLNFLLGCWEGLASDGGERALRVTRGANVVIVATGARCDIAIPLWQLALRNGRIEALQAEGLAGSVHHGAVMHWATFALSSDLFLMGPGFAPTWEQFKRLAPDRIEWAHGTTRHKMEAVVLHRKEDSEPASR